MDKAQLFAKLKAEVKAIEIAAIGEFVKFRTLTGTARDAWHTSASADDKSMSFKQAALVAATVVNDAGEPVFTPEDVAALQESNAVALSQMAQAAMDVNGIGAKAEEQAAKN